jgi:hypothetical protein
MPRFFRYPNLKESLRGLLPWEMNITGVDIVHRHLADDITTSAAARPRIVTAVKNKKGTRAIRTLHARRSEDSKISRQISHAP